LDGRKIAKAIPSNSHNQDEKAPVAACAERRPIWLPVFCSAQKAYLPTPQSRFWGPRSILRHSQGMVCISAAGSQAKSNMYASPRT